MTRILINYADTKYRPAQRWNSISGKYIGKFDKIYQFSPEDIDVAFQNKYQDIFSFKRGNGLWLWKPYLINKILERCKNGDLIFYCDSGAIFIRSIKSIENYVEDKKPIFVTDLPLIESNWTKPECFNLMNCKTQEFRLTNQIQGTFILIKVNDISRKFIKKWLDLCCRIELISPAGLKKNEKIDHNYNYSFVSHREDQSILSLLCKKEGIMPHRDISQRGYNQKWYYNSNYAYLETNHKNDQYSSLVYLHKSPNPNLWFWTKLLIKKIIRR